MQATPEEKALWQQRIDVWRESGLKQSVWCCQNGVKDYQFLYWKKKRNPKIYSQGQRLLNRLHLFQ